MYNALSAETARSFRVGTINRSDYRQLTAVSKSRPPGECSLECSASSSRHAVFSATADSACSFLWAAPRQLFGRSRVRHLHSKLARDEPLRRDVRVNFSEHLEAPGRRVSGLFSACSKRI